MFVYLLLLKLVCTGFYTDKLNCTLNYALCDVRIVVRKCFYIIFLFKVVFYRKISASIQVQWDVKISVSRPAGTFHLSWITRTFGCSAIFGSFSAFLHRGWSSANAVTRNDFCISRKCFDADWLHSQHHMYPNLPSKMNYIHVPSIIRHCLSTWLSVVLKHYWIVTFLPSATTNLVKQFLKSHISHYCVAFLYQTYTYTYSCSNSEMHSRTLLSKYIQLINCNS